jgi:hypothetical protein
MQGIMFKPEVLQGKLKACELYGEAVTRRLLKPQPAKGITLEEMCKTTPEGWQTLGRSYQWTDQADTRERIWKPRYHVGEVVYVKEFCKLSPLVDPDSGIRKGFMVLYGDNCGHMVYDKDIPILPHLVKPQYQKMFMPAWAARYFFQITSVDAQRLQEFPYSDVCLEGIFDTGIIPFNTAMLATGAKDIEDLRHKLGISQYAELWDYINPNYTWEFNPYVLRYGLKLVNKNDARQLS